MGVFSKVQGAVLMIDKFYVDPNKSWIIHQQIAFEITAEDARELLLNNWDWLQNRLTKLEFACPHGVGHSLDVHGCDGCCRHKSFKKVVYRYLKRNKRRSK